MQKLKVQKFRVHQIKVYDFKEPDPVKKRPVIGLILFAGLMLAILLFGLYGYPCSECIDLIFNP